MCGCVRMYVCRVRSPLLGAKYAPQLQCLRCTMHVPGSEVAWMRALLPGLELFDTRAPAAYEPSWWSYMDAYSALHAQRVEVRVCHGQRSLLQRPSCVRVSATCVCVGRGGGRTYSGLPLRSARNQEKVCKPPQALIFYVGQHPVSQTVHVCVRPARCCSDASGTVNPLNSTE